LPAACVWLHRDEKGEQARPSREALHRKAVAHTLQNDMVSEARHSMPENL